ncbi:MAG: hypothetical protein HPY75_10215 [Actinobacteria bacterium]|nr:hypothetical protein [Actinomycetota bacterium]
MIVLFVLLVVLVDIVITMAFLTRWIKSLRVEAVERMKEMTEGETVYHVEDCNFFGRASKGYWQWRGNGLLALTDRGLRFRQLVPRTEISIPIGAISSVSDPSSFLGKSRMKKLLRVDFQGEGGEEDACAWLLPSLEWWKEALEALRSGKEPPAALWESGP